MQPKIWDAIIIGAGAAGLFAALRAKECDKSLQILVLEKGPQTLRKVRISGGGRCNVTHDCHDLDDLLACYPRGGPRLEAILGRFMPGDTIDWFALRGVKLKTEADGRMFPVSNNSETITKCLLDTAAQRGVEIRTKTSCRQLKRGQRGGFVVQLKDENLRARRVLLATGGGSKATDWLRDLKHEIIADIPSLFTFCCKDPRISRLPGTSVAKVSLTLKTDPEWESTGPLLVTHWGLSGPAVLKLSAFAARSLFECQYRASLICDLLPAIESQRLQNQLQRLDSPKQILNDNPFQEIPKRLWQSLVSSLPIKKNTSWKNAKPTHLESIVSSLKALEFQVEGKGVFKEEFVTAGGLPLHEVSPYTMESKRCKGLFVAGELLDVDGITGGFNFQNAWATGYIAGEGLAAE